jgi:predicted nucleic acid-binding protein
VIVLDTNVVAEPLRARPDAVAMAWLDEQAHETLFISAITQAELLFGVAALPSGKRKNALSDAVLAILGSFAGRILPFDEFAAGHYGELAAKARSRGQGLPLPDAYIAAIAGAHGFTVASRDTAPYEAARVSVINPFAG